MSITINGVPSTIRTPGFFVELDPTGASQAFGAQPYKVLVIGQRLSDGSVLADVPTRVGSAEQARLFFGQGSMLHMMAVALFANSQVLDYTFVAMDDPAAGVKAVGSIKADTVATASGTVAFYLGADRVQVAVTSAMTTAEIATAIQAAVAALSNVQFDAAVDGSDATKVNFTAKHKGTIGNQIPIKHSHKAGEFLPAGLTLTVVQPTGGSGEPDLASALANTGGDHFNVMAVPYTDTNLLDVLEQDLEDRAGPTKMQGAVAFTATPLGWGAALAFGDGRNSQHVSVMSCFGSPSTPWEWAAAIAATVSESASVHPAQPFQTLPLYGVTAPGEGDRYGMTENNGLLYDGISSHTVDDGGVVRIQRMITMNQTDATGGPTVALLDVNTPLTLERLRFDLRNRFASKYPRAMLGDDGVRSAPGQIVVTPSVARAEVIGLFNEWMGKGFVEAPDQFEQDLQVERNVEDPNRLDILLRPNLMNQLRVFGAKIQFKL